jgi:hypothetical protein
MEGCPSTIGDSKRHRYQAENLREQTGEESENVFVQKGDLEKKKKKKRKVGGSSPVSTFGIAFGQLKVHFTTKVLTFKVLDRHVGLVLDAVSSATQAVWSTVASHPTSSRVGNAYVILRPFSPAQLATTYSEI